MTVAEKGLPAEGAPPETAAAPRRKPTTFAGDVLKLVSGTTIAQAIGVLVTPLLTRLYAPEAFGTLALFTSITSIITVVACLRYELAIMLAETDEEAANLLAASLVAVLGITALTIPVVTLGRPLLLRLLNAPELGPYLWLVPVAVFFGGGFSALNYWNSRTKQFGRLSVARVISAVGTHSAKLGAGYAGLATGGALIGATVLGPAVSTLELARRIWRDDGAQFLQSVRLASIWRGLSHYRRFPQIDVWSALLNTLSWQLPALMLSYFFSATVVGHYALGLRVLQLPMSLIGGAIAQVFFQRAAAANRRGTLGQLVAQSFGRLVVMGLLPMLLVGMAGGAFFQFLFGHEWYAAGIYAQILSTWAFFWFISSPLSTLYAVLERQSLLLMINGAIIITRFISLWVGASLGSAVLALAIFSASGSLVYGFLGFKVMHLCGVSAKEVATPIGRSLSASLPVVATIGVLLVLRVAPALVTAAAGVGLCSYYFYEFRRDEKVKAFLRRVRSGAAGYGLD